MLKQDRMSPLRQVNLTHAELPSKDKLAALATQPLRRLGGGGGMSVCVRVHVHVCAAPVSQDTPKVCARVWGGGAGVSMRARLCIRGVGGGDWQGDWCARSN